MYAQMIQLFAYLYLYRIKRHIILARRTGAVEPLYMQFGGPGRKRVIC